MLGVRAHVKDIWEFDAVVKFAVGEGIHVEYDPLQMYEENIRHAVKRGLSRNCHCLLATIAFVVLDELFVSVFSETVKDRALILDL